MDTRQLMEYIGGKYPEPLESINPSKNNKIKQIFPQYFSIEPTARDLSDTPYYLDQYPQPLAGYLHIVNEMKLSPEYLNKESTPMSIYIVKDQYDSDIYHMSAIIPICHEDCTLCLDNILHFTRLTDREFLSFIPSRYTDRSSSRNPLKEEKWKSIIHEYNNNDVIFTRRDHNEREYILDESKLFDIIQSVAVNKDKFTLFLGTNEINLQMSARAKSAMK